MDQEREGREWDAKVMKGEDKGDGSLERVDVGVERVIE
jgi:hypothetical protein